MDKFRVCSSENCQTAFEELVNACSKHRKAAVDLKEIGEAQKKKIKEYREFNSKLFEDIDQLEVDIKEKDDFANKLKKKRNDLEIEVKHLLKKMELRNEDILKLDIDLNKQKEVSNNAIKVLGEENERLKEQMELAFRKVEAFEKERNERKANEDVQENELLKEMKELNQEISNLKEINLGKEKQIQQIVEEKEALDEKILVLEIESGKVDESKMENEAKSFHSLAEEFKLCGITNAESAQFKCKHCDKAFGTKDGLKNHVDNIHKKDTLMKLINMEQKLLNQSAHFTFSVHRLKNMEVSQVQKPCYCNRFCVISHTKHNWRKSVSDDMMKEFSEIKSSMCSMWKNVGEESENGEA
jgi:DNA repair exonuclease SbcCD ATPase subunit